MVYVDNMAVGYGRMIMCHCIADTQEELFEMMDKIGVQRKWVQNYGTPREHFDIALSKKKLAIQFGAKEITMRELATMTENIKLKKMKSNEELAIENITKLKVQVCEFLLKRGEAKMLVSKQKSYTGNELICEIHQNTEVGIDFINRLILLGLDLFSRQKEELPISQNTIIEDKVKDTGGLDQYFKDVEKWENSFYCNECGTDNHTTDFHYSRSVANGDVYKCNNCKNEIVVYHKPNEDNY